MWMTIGNDEDEQVVEFERRGATFRFAVGSPTAHGLPWRVWANPNSRDIYLMVRASNTASKWSFHASGDWRLQHLPEHVAARGVERIIDSWTRPEPDLHGLVHAITIRTPTDDLAPNETYPVKGGDVKWIPPAPPGHFVGVHLMVLAVPDHRVYFAGGSYVLAVIPLVDDTVAMLVVSIHPFTTDVLAGIHDAHQRALSIADPDTTADPDARMTLYGHEDDGKRFIWDIRLQTSVFEDV